MRGVLTLLGIAVLIVAGLIYLGFINVGQTRPGIVQAPQFHADVGRLTMGTENKTVAVPTISVQKPADAATPAPTH